MVGKQVASKHGLWQLDNTSLNTSFQLVTQIHAGVIYRLLYRSRALFWRRKASAKIQRYFARVRWWGCSRAVGGGRTAGC